MLGDRPLVPFPDLERRWHIGIALKIDRKRQRVHHGAAGALSDVRRQRVRGVADDRHSSGRPAAQLDEIEAVVAALRAETVDQRRKVGKPGFPRILSHRRRFGHFVTIEHRERNIDVRLAAGRIEHAPGARPIFNGCDPVRRHALLVRLCDKQTRGAVDEILALE